MLKNAQNIKQQEDYTMNLPKRKSPRLKEYDYSLPGAYFVTICTKERKEILSHITVGQGLAPAGCIMTTYGNIAKKQVELLEERYDSIKIDKYVIIRTSYKSGDNNEML